MKEYTSIGEEIVDKSKSPFIKNSDVVSWINHEIDDAIKNARYDERASIEKQIAHMSKDQILEVWKELTCRKMEEKK